MGDHWVLTSPWASNVARHWCKLLEFGSSLNYLREVNVRFILFQQIGGTWQGHEASGLVNTAIETETACRSCYICNATIYMHTCMLTILVDLIETVCFSLFSWECVLYLSPFLGRVFLSRGMLLKYRGWVNLMNEQNLVFSLTTWDGHKITRQTQMERTKLTTMPHSTTDTGNTQSNCFIFETNG